MQGRRNFPLPASLQSTFPNAPDNFPQHSDSYRRTKHMLNNVVNLWPRMQTRCKMVMEQRRTLKQSTTAITNLLVYVNSTFLRSAANVAQVTV